MSQAMNTHHYEIIINNSIHEQCPPGADSPHGNCDVTIVIVYLGTGEISCDPTLSIWYYFKY